nr:hypothetical protein [uncultured Carboxylicivirga sp.]
MNEIHFDLIRRYPRNMFRIVMGVLLLGSAAYFLIKQVEFFTLTHLLIFSLGGLYYLLMGLGINPLTVWGKAYISVNPSTVAVKPTIFAKSNSFKWANINEAQIKVMGIRFLFNQGEPFELEFGKLDEDRIKELKRTIIAISKEKGIKLG